ncbi:erg26, C-3 sterol dehydrogenase [Trapelia coarctata]|nr:erg26, C-3 sterol dehydrogenase [Trapelia coarctata]
MPSTAPSVSLGSVLVVGGCGFLRFHIVRFLLEDPDCASVAVLSCNPTRNRLDGVSYHSGDITSKETLRALVAEIKPQAIIHAASPTAFGPSVSPKNHHRVNVSGTRNLLECAAEAPSVVAFVYTSTSSVCIDIEQHFATETCPVLTASSKTDSYAKTKAIAEALVLEANDPLGKHGSSLRTLSLRPCGIYGERDMQLISSALGTLQKPGGAPVQIGDNSNLVDWCYVGNATSAHILAAKALLAGTEDPTAPKVDGEVFFITDDAPVLFWDFIHKIWTAAGDTTPQERIWVLQASTALWLAMMVDWIYCIGLCLSALSARMCPHASVFCIVAHRGRFVWIEVEILAVW